MRVCSNLLHRHSEPSPTIQCGLTWANSSRDFTGQDQTILHAVDEPSICVLKHLKVDNTLRSYRIAVPSEYKEAASKKWPLIIDFHGRGGSALGQYHNSQYYLSQSGQEYFVVYPNGCHGELDKQGNPARAWQGAHYANPDCNDLHFVSQLLTCIQQDYPIDSKRIYASGKSNGGGFVDTLACSSTGDSFAAFAMAAAALYTESHIPPLECNGSRPRKILEAHGSADSVIPIGGQTDNSTPDNSTPNITLWTELWAERNGCDLEKDGTITYLKWGINTTYSCNGTANMIQQYNVTGLDHCWPSVTDNTDTPKHNGGCLIKTLNFTEAVLEFFAQ